MNSGKITKLYVTIVLILIVSLLYRGTTYASSSVSYEFFAGGKYGYLSDSKYETVTDAVNYGEAWLEAQGYSLVYPISVMESRDGYHFVCLIDNIENGRKKEQQIKEWMRDAMPKIVPEGTDIETALYLVHSFFRDRTIYQGDQQDPLVLIETGEGNCVAGALLFKMMTEYLPLDSANGNVRYTDNANEYHWDMKVIFGNHHAYNAMRTEKGWVCFDVTPGNHGDSDFGVNPEVLFNHPKGSWSYVDFDELYP